MHTTSHLPKGFKILLSSLVFMIAVVMAFLPASGAGSKGATSARSDAWQESNSPAPQEPDSPASAFVVNDNGDAPDISIGNGSCDSNAAAGDQCTLRAAIQEANSSFNSDTIGFSLPASSTITLTSVLPTINGLITIAGPGAASLTIQRSTAGGTPNFRIFTINSGTTATISGLTITNGRTADGVPAAVFGGSGDHGGGIHNSGALTLNDVVITGNRTGNGAPSSAPSDSGTAFGGPGGSGAGIYNAAGSLTMSNVTVSNNTTGNGAIDYYGGSGGSGAGIFMFAGPLTMTDCVVNGNVTGTGAKGTTGGFSSGGGGSAGGVYIRTGTTTITNSSINNNTTGSAEITNAGNSGSGGLGGGVYIEGGNLTITGSSISGNHTGDGVGAFGQGGFGGGVFNSATVTIDRSTINGNSTGKDGVGGGLDNSGTLFITNSTISGNSTSGTSGSGGGLWNARNATLTNCTIVLNNGGTSFGGAGIHHFSASSFVTIRNTIVALNVFTGNPNGPDVSSGPAFNSLGHNLVGNADGSTGFTATGDQVGTSGAPLDPQLSSLANNGGLTMTHAPLDGSPALDAGDDCVTQPTHCGDSSIPQLTTDQRGPGFSRLTDGPDANTTATVDIGAYERQSTFPNLANTSGNEDTTVFVAFEVLDPGSITSVTASSSNTVLVPNNPSNLSVSGSGSNRVVTINPVANLSGATDITITVNRTSGSENRVITVTINPVNDAPSFTKGLDQSVNENSGAQTVNNWATAISPGPGNESGQTVAFQVSNNNASLFAVAPAISPSGTLTYTPAAGMSGTALITVALMDDGGTGNGGVNTSANQTFNINVLEGGTLQFSSSQYSAGEGSGTATITVTRSGGFAGEARVDYTTVAGSAIDGQDFTGTSGTLIFPDTVTSRTFTVTILQDTLDETTEPIGLTLSNATGTGSLGVPNNVSLLIIDDDPPPTLRISDVAVTEGDSGTVNAVFNVTLSGPTSFNVMANFTTADGSASATTDYQFAIGQVLLSPGEVSKTITVLVNGDVDPELNETFLVNLTNVTGASVADSQGVGTIVSDDAPGGSFSFNVLHSNVNENDGFATIVVNRSGNTSAAVTVDYATFDANASLAPCSSASLVAAARCDFTAAFGTLRYPAGSTSQSFVVLINQDNFVESPETLTLNLSNPTGGAVLGGSFPIGSGSLTIFSDATEPIANPIDDAENFVRQHYHDFLNREADAPGLAFWTDQIASCGTDTSCIEVKRINVSAAFYLSIEFQETGYLVERMYKIAYGNPLGNSTFGGPHQIPVPVVRLNEFLADSQEIARGVVVGTPGWEGVLATNKQLFADRFVARSRFTAGNAFPTSLTPSQFVDKLNTNAGGVLLPDERIQLINELSTGAKTRAQVVRTIAEDSDLVIAEKNRAFVLMQYFGYLRRNPNDSPDADYTGYDFWLTKLNQFAGNFVNAEMVKAFITSGEYRQRFGQ